MVESEFGAGQQGPDELHGRRPRAGRCAPRGTCPARDDLSSSGGRESTLRTASSICSAGDGDLLQAADQAAIAVGQEILRDLLAVAEEERLGHADLGVAR